MILTRYCHGILSVARWCCPDAYEQSVAKVDLGVVSKGGWQANIPWYVISGTTSLNVTLSTKNGSYGTDNNILLPISAPDFSYFMALNTISAFSDAKYTGFDYDSGNIASKYAQDYYSILPFSKVIKSDYSQSVWPELVIVSDGKAKRFDSVDALKSDTLADHNTYTIVKNHLAQRLMSANSGEGLKSNKYDLSSGFIFGNYATFGVRKKLDGTYENIHTGSAAGGLVGQHYGHMKHMYMLMKLVTTFECHTGSAQVTVVRMYLMNILKRHNI